MIDLKKLCQDQAPYWDGHTDKDVKRLLSLEPSWKLEHLKDCLRKEKEND